MYISANEAAKKIGCSLTTVHVLVKREKILGKFELLGRKKVLLVCPWSVLEFQSKKNPNSHIGRKLKSRKPRRMKYKNKGYVLVYSPKHPRAMVDGYVYEHWLVMERKLKRYLTERETVHHINRIRDDNRIANLKLYSSQSEHMRDAHSIELINKLEQV